MLCCAALCCAVLCYAMLCCYAMACRAPTARRCASPSSARRWARTSPSRPSESTRRTGSPDRRGAPGRAGSTRRRCKVALTEHVVFAMDLGHASYRVFAAQAALWLLCCAVLCCAVLCCAVLCYAMLCHAMLHRRRRGCGGEERVFEQSRAPRHDGGPPPDPNHALVSHRFM